MLFPAKEGFELMSEKEQFKGENFMQGKYKFFLIHSHVFIPRYKLLAQVHFLYLLHVYSTTRPSDCVV